jgi:hypothetical protein
MRLNHVFTSAACLANLAHSSAITHPVVCPNLDFDSRQFLEAVSSISHEELNKGVELFKYVTLKEIETLLPAYDDEQAFKELIAKNPGNKLVSDVIETPLSVADSGLERRAFNAESIYSVTKGYELPIAITIRIIKLILALHLIRKEKKAEGNKADIIKTQIA